MVIWLKECEKTKTKTYIEQETEPLGVRSVVLQPEQGFGVQRGSCCYHQHRHKPAVLSGLTLCTPGAPSLSFDASPDN